MCGSTRVPLWSVATEVRKVVEPKLIATDVFHYSIPVVDETGTGRVEAVSDIGSAKMLLRGGEVLISKLNPRKGRVLISEQHDLPVLSSTEFVALRPGPDIDSRFLSYVLSSETTRQQLDASVQSVTRSHQRVAPERIRHLMIELPDLEEQRRIAAYLDKIVEPIDRTTSTQRRMLEVLEERVDQQVLEIVGDSDLVPTGRATSLPIKRLLVKRNRRTRQTEEVVTAFRDGQVTSRSIRRSEGYTLPSGTEAQGQGVEIGDVVVHGLDGFAGAIGDSEAEGNCSPVYHVCTPTDGGNPVFYGRLLRVLAIHNYLGLFATSTRERAVDFRSWDLFGNIPIPEVKPTIQHELGQQISAIRPLRKQIERSNALLAERRQALITATVACHIDPATVGSISVAGGTSE